MFVYVFIMTWCGNLNKIIKKGETQLLKLRIPKSNQFSALEYKYFGTDI